MGGTRRGEVRLDFADGGGRATDADGGESRGVGGRQQNHNNNDNRFVRGREGWRARDEDGREFFSEVLHKL